MRVRCATWCAANVKRCPAGWTRNRLRRPAHESRRAARTADATELNECCARRGTGRSESPLSKHGKASRNHALKSLSAPHRLPKQSFTSLKLWEEHMKSLIVRFVREEAGQDLIEYALLAGFISLVAVVAITSVGSGVNAVYNNIDSQVDAIPTGTGGAGS